MNPILENKKTTNPIAQSNVGPIASLASNAMAARFWFGVSMVLLVSNVGSILFLASSYAREQKVVVVDPSGTFYITPLLGFSDPSDIHSYTGMLATLAYFQRNPKGLDFPDLYDQVFIKPAHSKGLVALEKEKQEFVTKSIQQTPKITGYQIARTSVDRARVVVTGYLSRQGQLKGTAIPLANINFKATYKLARNPRMTENGRLPLAVFDYQFQFNEESSTPVRK